MGVRQDLTAAIGDPHCPFLHKPTFEWQLKAIEYLKPKYCVVMGDVHDMYSFSRFGVRLHNSPKHEMDESYSQWQEMARLLRLVSPDTIFYCLRGNHDARGVKMLYEKYGPAWEVLTSERDFWKADGFNIIYDAKEPLELNGVLYTHGHRKFGDHCPSMDYKSVVIGHLHKGEIKNFRMASGEIRFEMCVGYTGDPFHPALNYRPLNKYFNWHHGLGLVDSHGPRFLPFYQK